MPNKDMKPTVGIRMSLAERLRSNMDTLTKAERRVGHVLLANNLIAGLDTVAAVASQAKASGPTVLRFIAKQGFSGYPEFQLALREEIAERVSSPVTLIQRGKEGPRGDKGSILAGGLAAFTEGLNTTFRADQAAEVAAITRLLADRKRHVWIVGGRFSQMIAEILWTHIGQVRAKAHLVSPVISRRQEVLLDVRREHVVVALDFRRYQDDTITFAAMAKERGAKLALVTDHWLSPIAKFADHIVTCDVDAPSPFDSLVSPLAIIESLMASVTQASGAAGRHRIKELESIRKAFDESSRSREQTP